MYGYPDTCQGCKFFRPLTEEDTDVESDEWGADAAEYGRCVRYPPTFFHHNLLNGEFPVVRQDAWCGEYRRSIGQ